MRPLDPRLLRYASATRTYLVLCVGLGVVAAGLIVAQATLIATAVTRVFPTPADLFAGRSAGSHPGGDLLADPGATGLAGVGSLLLALAAVIVGRTVVAWAQEVAAHRTATR